MTPHILSCTTYLCKAELLDHVPRGALIFPFFFGYLPKFYLLLWSLSVVMLSVLG